jgi:hypothetical protein
LSLNGAVTLRYLIRDDVAKARDSALD